MKIVRSKIDDIPFEAYKTVETFFRGEIFIVKIHQKLTINVSSQFENIRRMPRSDVYKKFKK